MFGKFCAPVLLFVLLACGTFPTEAVEVSAAKLRAIPFNPALKAETVNSLRSRVLSNGGCHANVCFALDGSSSQSTQEFTAQKNFVLDLVSIIAVDSDVTLAAVQYHNFYSRISHLTMDPALFVRRMNSATRRGGLSRTAIGIGRCARMLNRHRFGRPRKIILLGDGFSNIGKSAVFRANRARATGNALSVVAAGDRVNMNALTAIAGGVGSRVYQVDNFLHVLELEIIIQKLVDDICELRN